MNRVNSVRFFYFLFEPKIMPIINRVISAILPLDLKYLEIRSNNDFRNLFPRKLYLGSVVFWLKLEMKNSRNSS